MTTKKQTVLVADDDPRLLKLIQRKDARQHITFAGQEARDFTAQRCREMKVSTAMIEKASRAAAAALEQNEWPHPLIGPSTTRRERRA